MSSRESRMSSTTVAQFANELNRPAKELLELLRDAGVELSSVDDPITEADKAKLLTSLQGSAHGSRRITLTHRETAEIRQADSSGRSRTIPVETRRSRVFVKRDRSELLAEAAKRQEELREQAAQAVGEKDDSKAATDTAKQADASPTQSESADAGTQTAPQSQASAADAKRLLQPLIRTKHRVPMLRHPQKRMSRLLSLKRPRPRTRPVPLLLPRPQPSRPLNHNLRSNSLRPRSALIRVPPRWPKQLRQTHRKQPLMRLQTLKKRRPRPSLRQRKPMPAMRPLRHPLKKYQIQRASLTWQNRFPRPIPNLPNPLKPPRRQQLSRHKRQRRLRRLKRRPAPSAHLNPVVTMRSILHSIQS